MSHRSHEAASPSRSETSRGLLGRLPTVVGRLVLRKKADPTSAITITSTEEAPNPAAIRQLEALDADVDFEQKGFWGIRPRDKADALLVAAGVRPAALTYFMGESFSADEPPKAPHDSSAEYMDVLRKLGLYTASSEGVMDARPDPARPGVPRYIATRTVYMSNTEQGLDKLMDAAAHYDRRGIGLALGYPGTSVEAFISGDRVPAFRISGIDPALQAFNFFTLSSEHAQEELAVAATWAATIRRISPATYDAAVERYISGKL